jgi:hypothetical protein
VAAHFFTPAEISFLERNAAGRSYAELAGMFNRRLGLSLSLEQIKGVLGRYGLRNGRDCRFRPGQTPFNKGKKGHCPAGSEKGWFKPGGMPHNWRPVGTERINRDGYVEVKIRDPKTWKAKQRIVWEAANGKIPRGGVVIFADGDRLNFAPDNLVLVSRRELAVMNRLGLITADGDLTLAAKAVADIKILIADRKRGVKDSGKQRAKRTRERG